MHKTSHHIALANVAIQIFYIRSYSLLFIAQVAIYRLSFASCIVTYPKNGFKFSLIYVTVFAKTDYVPTKTEITYCTKA